MPGFVLQMWISTTATGLMQRSRRTFPATFCTVSNIVAEARPRVSEHLQVAVAINRRRITALLVGKTDKDVVVVFDSGVGRWIPGIFDLQSDAVGRVNNIALEYG